MLENQLSRWGSVSKVLERVGPYSKVFFVGDSDDTGFVDFVNEFPPDKDGVVRVYSSMFDSTMLANARAGRGDVIMVMPGHSEIITTDQALTVKGLKLIGLGEGDERPLIDFNDAAASISLDTGGIHLENFRFRTTITGVTRGLDIPGPGCVVSKCSFEFDATGDDFADAIRVTAAGHRTKIEDNEFLLEDTVGHSNAILVVGGANYVQVNRNRIHGMYSVAAINYDSTAASEGILIKKNTINNTDTAANLVIKVAHASSRGVVRDNRAGASDSATAEASLVERGLTKWFENYLTSNDQHSGILIPAATT